MFKNVVLNILTVALAMWGSWCCGTVVGEGAGTYKSAQKPGNTSAMAISPNTSQGTTQAASPICNSSISIPSDDGKRCLEKGVVKLGYSCEKAKQCVGDPSVSSTCTKRKVCGCMPGYPPSSNFDDCFVLQNELGGKCKESQQCTLGTPGPFSVCTAEGKCNCSSKSVSEGNGDICYPKATLVGQKCEVTEQCTANLMFSHCFNRTSCECWVHAVPNRNKTKCQLNRNLGDICEYNHMCDHIPSTVCSNDKKCECDEGFGRNPNENNSACMKWAAKIGDRCNEDKSQCEKNLFNVTCVLNNGNSNNCYCIPGQVESEDETACLPALLKLNDSCIENAQCNVSDSACFNSTDGSNRCSCVPGYVKGMKLPNQCFQVRSAMGDSCTEDVQCRTIGSPLGTVPCNHGYCHCDYHSQVTSQDKQRCLPKRNNLNATCTESIQCQMRSGICSNFVCTCGAGYKVDGDECAWVSISNNSPGVIYSQVNNTWVVIIMALVSLKFIT